MSGGILIVSAGTGTGHTRAGEALQAAFRKHEVGVRVEHVDLLQLAPSWVRTAYADGYELIATRAPWLWRQLYHRTDRPGNDLLRWAPRVHRSLFETFRSLTEGEEWDECVCTHFLPAQLGGLAISGPNLSTVITDMSFHRAWAQPGVTHYFVANNELALALRSAAPSAHIEVSGIPISDRFGNAPSRTVAREAIGVDREKPVVLVVGGGLGLRVSETTRAVATARVADLQIVAVCGRNEAALNDLRALSGSRPGIFPVGYVGDLETYIAAADLVVTKPGGPTTSEVLAAGRPLLLTNAIPGQEEGNAQVLDGLGAAVFAPEADCVPRTVERLFDNRRLLSDLELNARRHGRPDAATFIASRVLQRPVPVAAA